MNPLFYRNAYVATKMAQEASSSASAAASTAGALLTRIESLESDVERLLMITEALWQFISENNLITDGELVERIREIDLRDGRLDGRVAKQKNPECPQCGRTIIGKHPVCLYCGSVVDRDPFQR